MWSWTRTATNPTCRIAALNSTRAANMPCCILIPNTLLHYTTRAANLQGSTLYYPLSPAQPCCLLAILCSPVGRALQAAFYYPHLLHYTLLHSGRVTLPLAMALNSLLSALPCPPIRLAHCLSTPLHHSALPPSCLAICALRRSAEREQRRTSGRSQLAESVVLPMPGAEQGGLRQNKIPVITTVITLNSANATIGQPCTLSGEWESVE